MFCGYRVKYCGDVWTSKSLCVDADAALFERTVLTILNLTLNFKKNV